MYKYNAKVVRWVDGDTVDLLVDLGFNIALKERFRLYDPNRYINTPERNEPNWAEARQCSESVAPVDSLIAIETFKKDKYGRWLVYLPAVNGALLESGFLK